ncbi:MAG: ATP-binding protein [Methylacidiphilales bacterium]|nr:ATP-binding protein [Candidatus Methylacidiphilales bacterium]
MSQPNDARKETPRIKVRLVWRLVLSLLIHLALLLVLAIYLVISLNSVESYTPVAQAAETELESLNTLPALLRAMDAERRSYQKGTDPHDLALFNQTRQQVEDNLASLNSPFLLASPAETSRRSLVQQWIDEVGAATVDHPGLKPPDLEQLSAHGTDLLAQIDTATTTVRHEIETTLAGLKEDEANEAQSRVTMMWIGVGTVTIVTIVLQLLISNSIISPIQALAGAVRRLQAGDYTVRVHIHSGDEIESLGETFNAMAANILRNQLELEEKNSRLSEQQEALRGANVGLEERVAEKTRELEDKNQKLHEAARLKDEFLATLSHELRTPLTPVISCAHLLATDPQLGQEQVRNVNVIDRNARALSRMIDELLDLSAVMNRKLRLAREKVEMNEWTRATLETMRPAWQRKSLGMTFIPSTQPVELEIDPPRLAQVLTNLINNAIKFTDPRGKITVRVAVTENEVRIAVTDNGAGLKRGEIDKIFEMFHQSLTQRTESVGGLGVGLTVARSLAELHGGGLLAESPGPGQGATFTLWLPRLTPPEIDFSLPQDVAVKPPLDLILLKDKRLLVVEDATDTREALQRIYQRRGCQVIAASSAEEALELAVREWPDIIISDIGLPGISGLELMIRLRTRSEFHDVVAIALSGLGREQDIRAAAEAGFDAHLLKPIEMAMLDQTLVEALQKRIKPA